MRVLGISGSLREGSHNTALLEAAAGLLAPRAELEIWSGLGEVPPYNEDLDRDPVPGEVQALRQSLQGADAVLFATPEYNGSLPGQLKNALDWASRPFPDNSLRNRPAAVVGASTGLFGAVWAQAELRKVLRTIGANVVELEVPVAQSHLTFDGGGNQLPPETEHQLRSVLDTLVDTAHHPTHAA